MPEQPITAERQKPGSKAAALEKAMVSARAAGAPDDALDAMGRELAALRSEIANSRPLGARLDSAKAKLAKAEAKVHAAEASMEKAMRQLEEARQQRKQMEESLAVLQQEVPQQAPSLPDEWVRSTKVLLERLESGGFAATAAMPQELVSAMTAVHQIVNAVDPLPHPAFDVPLEPDADQGAKLDVGATRCQPEVGDEDDVMGSLDGVDEADDNALLAIARRLKRARRH